MMINILCFGTFARTLQPAIQKPNGNQAVVEILLGLVTDMASEGRLNANYSVKPKKGTALWNFTDEIHEEVAALATTDKIMTAMPDAIRRNLLTCLVSVQLDDLIENLRKLLIADKRISPDKRDGLLALARKEQLAEFLSAVFLYALSRTNKILPDKGETELSTELGITLDDIDTLNAIYKKARRPKDLDVPDEPVTDELTYIAELLSAYAESLGIDVLSRDVLTEYKHYNADLRQRRKEYYAAETIRRGTREVFGETDPDQFNVLKEETYDGIFDVHSQDYKSGYERLLEVMKHVTSVQINKSPLNKLPDWIGPKEKKGICHILVNDGTIKWVVCDD